MGDGKIDFRLHVTTSNWVAHFEPVPNLPVLVVEAVTALWRDPDHVIYNVPLTTLTQNEANLQSGRFAHFHNERQAVSVALKYHHTNNRLCVSSILDWIGQHVSHAWSLSVLFYDVMEAEFTWTFENATDAMIFKLSWA